MNVKIPVKNIQDLANARTFELEDGSVLHLAASNWTMAAHGGIDVSLELKHYGPRIILSAPVAPAASPAPSPTPTPLPEKLW